MNETATFVARPGASMNKHVVVPAAILLVAAILRIHGIGEGGLDHTELYIPGLDLPEEASPGPRRSIAQTVHAVLAEPETHPPGYYVLMHPWTAVFGAGRVSIRMPSALLGVLSVALVMLICRRVHARRSVAYLAGGMMALSGSHVFWSQHAKMYEPGVAFGLLSTWALLEVHAREPRRAWTPAVYVLATLAALGTLHHAWLLLAAQVAWILVARRRSERVPAELRLQLVTVALAMPLFAVAAIQSARASYVDPSLATFVGYAAFGYHLSPSQFATAMYAPPKDWAVAAIGVLALACAALVVLGIVRPGDEPRDEPDGSAPADDGRMRLLFWGALVVGLALTVAPIAWTAAVRPVLLKRVVVIACMPLVGLLVVQLGLPRWWSLARFVTQRWAPAWCARANSLPVLCAVLPVAAMAAAIPVTVLAAPRTCLLFTPYLLIAAAAGLAALLVRNRLGYGLVALVALSHVAGTVHYRAVDHHPRNWDRLAAMWKPQLTESDVIFVEKYCWPTSGVFIVLPTSEHRYVFGEWARFVEDEAPDRVWVLRPQDLEIHPPFVEALAGYEPVETLDAPGMSAILFARP